VGAPVRVGGAIDVRLLPTPSLALRDVQIGPANSTRKVSARGLSMEFALNTLMRGEFRANQVTLDRPDVRVGIDRSGGLQMPGLALSFDPGRLAIERLTITDGQLHLTDAANGAKLTVEGLNVSGDVASLIGPFKLEGTFTVSGEHYFYRLAGARRGDDGGMKVRLAVDPVDRALAFESDGTVWIEGGSPRYQGAATLSRVVGTAGADGHVILNDPWKVSGKIKATSDTVLVDQMEMLYGPESRVLRFGGSAIMNLGREPRIASTLTARQVDFDRLLPTTDQKRSPFETVKLLVDELADMPAPPLPIRISLGVDSVIAGGATVAALRGDVETDSKGWSLDRLEMRAPGATQMLITGKLALTDQNVEFQGPVKVDSSDPTTFFAWIEGRSAAGRPSLGPMRGSGTVTLGRERVAVYGLKADIDRRAMEGRVAYRFATPTAPPRLDAALSGAELDIDRSLSLASALFASTSFERPGEIALALDIGRASYAGVEARKAQATLTYDHSGLKIERLSIADIAGAAIDASGRLDNAADAWRGSVAVSLAAPRLDGVTLLADKFLPQASGVLRKYGARVAPLKINAKLDVEPRTVNAGATAILPANATAGAANGRTAAKLKLDGTIAGIDVTIDANGIGEITDLAAATMHVGGRLDTPDGRALASLIGLDALANADSRPARMTFMADGAANRTFRVDGRFAGTDLSASAVGTMSTSGDGALDVAFRAANTKLPRRAGAGLAPVPADLRAHLAISGAEVAAMDLSGKVAGSTVKGAVTVGVGEPLRVNGRIETDQADASELFAIVTGAPRPAGASADWVTEPFGAPAAPPLEGRIEFRVASAQWMAGTPAKDLAGAVTFKPSGFSLADVTGRVADGRFALDGELRRDSGGVFLRSHVTVSNADMPVLLAGALRVPAAGRLSLEAEMQGQGLSPASLVGSITGNGTLTAENFEISGLDPNAADAVLNALEADRGLAGNPARVTQIANTSLDAGKLKIASLATPIVIADGRAQLTGVQASAQNADISGLVSLALADWQLNARITMTAPRKNAPGAERPVMTVTTRGPLSAARRSVDVAGLINWSTMRAIDQEAKRLDEAERERRRMEGTIDALRRQSDSNRQPDSASSFPPVVAPATSPSSAQGAASGFDRRPRPGGPAVPGP
jgi:AsmA-like protein